MESLEKHYMLLLTKEDAEFVKVCINFGKYAHISNNILPAGRMS